MFPVRNLVAIAFVTVVVFSAAIVPAHAGVPGADLQVIKTAPLLNYSPNSVVDYTIQVSNNGPATATTVQVLDQMPVSTSFVSVVAPPGWFVTSPAPGGTGLIICSTSSMAPQASATISVQLRIKATTFAGTFVANTATVSSQQPDPFPLTNSSTWTIEVTGNDTDTPGVVSSVTSAWFLRNTNSAGAGDLVFTYGAGGPTQLPIRGDFDNDGLDTAGIYDQSSGAFFLKNSNSGGAADIAFTFGPPSTNWIPLAGDWNNDGIDSIGLYDPSSGFFFLKNSNSPGSADLVFAFGAGGTSVPVAGDWNGDGADTIGIYAPASGTFFLRNSNSPGAADLAFTFGAAFSTPLTGDWDGDGIDTIGIYVGSTGAWFLRNVNSSGSASLVFVYGPPNLTPIAGDWNGL